MKPKLGLPVWYYAEKRGPSWRSPSAPWAALIAKIWDDGLVNLALIDPDGIHHSIGSVPLYQGEGDRPKGHYCTLMSDHITQGAEVEELERAEK